MVMANADETKASREDARRALAGEERYSHLAKKGQEVGKRRREAVKAMEGETHRHKRESKEKLAQAHATKEAAREAQEQAAKETTRKQEGAAAAEINRLKAEHEQARQQRVSNIEEGEKTIADLKRSTSILSPLRTYKSDFARAVQKGGLSVAKIAMSEQARRISAREAVANQPENLEKTRSRLVPIILTLALLGAAGGLAYYVINKRQPLSPPGPTVIAPPEALIFVENVTAVDLDKVTSQISAKALLDQATDQINSRVKSVRNIYFTKAGAVLNFYEFRQAFGLKIPDQVLRNLTRDFMLGLYSSGQSQSRFLLVGVNVFDQVYAGTLAWEATLVEDTLPLLYSGARVNTIAGRKFTDKTVRNKNYRLITDATGKVALLYALLDQKTLLITTSEEGFNEIFERYTTGQ